MTSTPRTWLGLMHSVTARDHHRCQMCGARERNAALSLHHITPRDEGGGDTAENLITLCRPCHNIAEAEHLATAEIIRNWMPATGRQERVDRITAAQEDIGSTDTCRDCKRADHNYEWRYFEGRHKDSVITLCVPCYNVRLNHGSPLALVLGQQIADRQPGEKLVVLKKAFSAHNTSVSALEKVAA
jgi:hypothetical protein